MRTNFWKTWIHVAWPVAIIGLVLLTRSSLSTVDTGIGKQLYQRHCLNCHQEDGQGVQLLVPPLAGVDYLSEHREDLPCIIRYGMQGPIQVNGRTYDHPMPGNESLSDGQIYNIIQYIQRAWGNEHQPLSLKEVRERLKACEP